VKKKKEQKQTKPAGRNSSPASKAETAEWKYYAALGGILLVTLIAYLPILQNGFVWDDSGYILGNPLIKDFSPSGIKAIFTDFSSDNYAPVTDILRAIIYLFSGYSPTAFHAVSILFHLVNIVLVFRFIELLCGSRLIAIVCALLFSLHPLQVESVAWASSGSNLFSSTFFLSALIAYLYYLRSSRKSMLAVSFLFFILALLSKAVVVVLPAVMLLIDYYKSRKITAKVLLEKTLFILPAIAVGILTLILKHNVGAVQDIAIFSFPQRMVFACYSFITYLFKLLLPLHLSAFYPYPVKNEAAIPASYYLYVLLFLGLAAYIIYAQRSSKKIIFSIGFFALTVVLVLQLLPVGGAIMAERYGYLPCIGIFYLVAEGFNYLWKKKQAAMALVALSAFSIFFIAKTYARTAVWKDDKVLWTDVINQHDNVPLAYNNRGAALKDEKKYSEALEDYSKAIALRPDYAEAYNNRGVILLDEGKTSEALNDLNKAVASKKNYAEAYSNRGIGFMNAGKNDEALRDYSKAIELDPTFTEAYVNRGNILRGLKKYDEALKDYNKAIEINPDFPKAYVNRGTLFMLESKNDNALRDLTKAISLKPDLAEAYYDRGIVFYNEKKYPDAIADYSKAIELKTNYADAYFNRGVAKYYAGDKQGCCADLQQAGRMGHPSVAGAYAQLCN
jgi:tetratricopeptide (TPR) repeat protein